MFEDLGCAGRTFVAAARAAYSDGGSGLDPDNARRLGRQLLTQTGQVMERLATAAAEYREAIERQKRNEQTTGETAARIMLAAQTALDEGLNSLRGRLKDSALDDPETVSAKLSGVAAESYERLRRGWQAVYAELPNALLPQTPMAFSQRQMYIETVKLFNQHRLSAYERGGGVDRPAPRGIFGRGPQRPDRAGSGAGASAQAMGSIISAGGDIIRGALEQWHRGAMERAMRVIAQASGTGAAAAPGEVPLPERLAIIERTSGQLVALRRELARGLSARWFLIGLLRQGTSPVRRPEAC